MATIRKRGARWQVQVRRQGIQCISRSFLLRADAEAWGRQKEVELDRGEFVWQTNANPKMTVGDLLTRYLTEITPAKRGDVPEAARIKTMLKAELATTRLKLLKSAHIASYRDHRLSKVSQGSVRREMAILQHCMSVALREWQLIATNPMAGVTKPTDNPSRSRRPSEAELQAIGGMDRQTLRDWVHRFNNQGPDGLCDVHAGGVEPRLSADKLAELAAIVEAGPDREKDGVVRWRRVDLQRVVKERFDVDYCERYIGTLLKKLGFSHISARPKHPA